MATKLARQQLFLGARHYAVVGASKDQTKWGTKVLQWYIARKKDVTPVHPKEESLEGITALKTLSELPDPTDTSVSIITNAKITQSLLQQAKELGIRAVWLQPGAEDDAVVDYIKNEGLADKAIYGGPCILVEGDGVLKSLL